MKLVHPEQHSPEIEVCPQQDRVCVFITKSNAIAIHSKGAHGERVLVIEESYLVPLISALQKLEKDFLR
jgi:hypothetical protein